MTASGASKAESNGSDKPYTISKRTAKAIRPVLKAHRLNRPTPESLVDLRLKRTVMGDPACVVCERPVLERFKVRDSVWRDAGVQMDGPAHMACLEAKLGRPLRMTDFNSHGRNALLYLGIKFARRDDVELEEEID